MFDVVARVGMSICCGPWRPVRCGFPQQWEEGGGVGVARAVQGLPHSTERERVCLESYL